MLFNSYIFVLLFLPLCLVGYFALNHYGKYSAGQLFLLIMSLWFYGYYNPWYLAVILTSILLNYGCHLLLSHFRGGGKLCKGIMLAGVAFNIGILVYFKYMDFFIANANALFGSNIGFLRLALPLGISFFTFQQMSFIIDTYREDIPRYNFLHYACFVAFFPQLVAGPIVSHDEIIPQFSDRGKKRLNFDNLAKGVYIFTIGLAKKILLADLFGDAVTYGFTTFNKLTSVTAFIVMLSYTLQIYFDFSGYSDMAIGLGKMFNIDLPVNFNSPYKSLTIVEFWDRWHMTLTRFFTKYVYIPLGGNRKGKVRTYVNIMIVFLLSGLWHGASWNFVFWGFCHGVFVVITRHFSNFFKKLHPALNWLITFSFVNVMWVFFRAETFQQALTLLRTLVSWNFQPIDDIFIQLFRIIELKKLLAPLRIESLYPPVLITSFFVLAGVLILGCRNSCEKLEQFKPSARNMLSTFILAVWCVFSFAGMSTFLYFNF
ncbi:MAG: MBOAT family protein [Roseburia sp.]|nr:MBOAT family protein [Roseburia sp.]MCM1096713.1 MBOAT family protein [Ruminococcus flavefaciens]